MNSLEKYREFLDTYCDFYSSLEDFIKNPLTLGFASISLLEMKLQRLKELKEELNL